MPARIVVVVVVCLMLTHLTRELTHCSPTAHPGTHPAHPGAHLLLIQVPTHYSPGCLCTAWSAHLGTLLTLQVFC